MHVMALSLATALLVLGATAASAAVAADVPSGGEQPPAGVVSATPATGTPHLKASADNPVQQIRQVVQCGGTMYAVGSFTEIVKGSTTYTRNNIVSFSATAPYTVTSWAPDVVGSTGNGGNNAINTIAFVNGNCADAYIGGDFSSVNGTSATNIAEISTTTGNVVSTFKHSANGKVETLLGAEGHLLAGGYFKTINGSSADPYFASLNPATGQDDGFVHLGISGNYSYAPNNPTRVYNQALSHGGTLDLVMGDFTSVGGMARQQIFMLNLAASPASVTGWTSPQWDGSNPKSYPYYQCTTGEPFYIQAAAWSPDDSTIYIGTTGYHPNGGSTRGSRPAGSLCDAAAAFPATQASVTSNWINYTGCDSLYAAAADSQAAYFGGHERWSMNPTQCDFQGTTAYPAPGMEGLDSANGNVYANSANTAGYYSRDRGLGADDMLLTSAGLWIASDNDTGSQMCGGLENLSGICFLPY
jgi:hypothetical protein